MKPNVNGWYYWADFDEDGPTGQWCFGLGSSSEALFVTCRQPKTTEAFAIQLLFALTKDTQ